MFGSHLSTAGGLHNALLEAQELGFECVQIFTRNQRQWSPKPLTDETVALWQAHRRSTGIDHAVSHDSYLINLAAADRAIREKSIRALVDELTRCEALGIGCLVAHPGAHVGQGERRGLQRIAGGLDRVHKATAGFKARICLENTAGQGTNLGYVFEHLRQIIDRVKQPERLGVCLDTAHALAAGYDLTSGAGARRMLDAFEQTLGLDRLEVVHVNDSKTPRGSRVDRHEHLGHGHVSPHAIKAIIKNRRLRHVPKILETPKAQAPDGRPWDAVNLQTLQRLAGP
jgi:deoxyribonuclease-4